MKKNAAFTLVELVLVITLIAVLSGFAVVRVLNFRDNQNFKLDAQMAAEAVRFAQSKARLGENGVDWGIRFTSTASEGYLEVFSGSSYSTSSVAEIRYLSSVSRFSNPPAGFTKTVLFTAITGLPSTGNSIVIQKAVADGEVYVVSVSGLGKIGVSKETDVAGMWLLDEGTGEISYDASGNGNTGALGNFNFSGSSNWTSLAKSGGGLSFDGNNDYADTGNQSVLQLTTGTVSAWVKTAGAGSSKRGIAVKQNAYGIFLKDDVFITHDWNTGTDRSSGVDVGDNTWHHVAITFQSGVTNGTLLYVDGVVRATTIITVVSQATSTAIGAGNPGVGENLAGTIDDVRIYSRELTATEIKNLYEQY